MDRVTILACISEAEAFAEEYDRRGLHDEATGARTVTYRLVELFEQAVDADCKAREAA